MIRPCRAFFMSKVFRGRVLRTQKLEFLSVENPEISRAFEEFACLEPGVCCNAGLHALPTAKECRPVYFFPLLLLLFVCLFCFLQLYCPDGISPTGKIGLLSPSNASCNKVALLNLRCMLGLLLSPSRSIQLHFSQSCSIPTRVTGIVK